MQGKKTPNKTVIGEKPKLAEFGVSNDHEIAWTHDRHHRSRRALLLRRVQSWSWDVLPPWGAAVDEASPLGHRQADPKAPNIVVLFPGSMIMEQTKLFDSIVGTRQVRYSLKRCLGQTRRPNRNLTTSGRTT